MKIAVTPKYSKLHHYQRYSEHTPSWKYIEAHMAADTPQSGPPTGVFLTAEWRDLVMLNYDVDPALLLKFVPLGTELDSWNGKTFLSLVGFRFLKTKMLGLLPAVSQQFRRSQSALLCTTVAGRPGQARSGIHSRNRSPLVDRRGGAHLL